VSPSLPDLRAALRKRALRIAGRVPAETRARGRAAMMQALEAHVREILGERRLAQRAATEALDALRRDASALARRVDDARARLDPGPVHAGTTVHAAHARHPGVAEIFARRGLPRCTDCAVGADETLAEAAAGEGFPLAALLNDIHTLLSPAPGATVGEHQ
jgi:hypothetical protein